MRGLLGERRRIGPLGSSHVAKVLDRMHESTVVRNDRLGLTTSLGVAGEVGRASSSSLALPSAGVVGVT